MNMSNRDEQSRMEATMRRADTAVLSGWKVSGADPTQNGFDC